MQTILATGLLCCLATGSDAQPKEGDAAKKASFKLDFGPGKIEPGYIQAFPENLFTAERGYGFEPGAKVAGLDRAGPDALRGDFCTSEQPFFFSVLVPEGNYHVTVTLGDAKGTSDTTIRAELRRLMLEEARTETGKFVTRTFCVNVRSPNIPGGGAVRLKDREKTTEAWAWDDKLTLEFNGARPCLCALEIVPAADIPTVYLLGDSTVCDQPQEPYSSWGQMLPRFFKEGVAVANHAESGETIRSALAGRRIEKVLSTMKPGDYLFLQFGHNDMRATDADTYRTDLEQIVTAVRKKGGEPVLVTPMQRRTFKGGTVVNSLAGFPDAVRRLAREQKVPLVDLHAMSATFYEAFGPEKSAAAFAPGDRTHHNNYGSYQLARCVVTAIRQNRLPLARWLADDVPSIDPAHPDDPATFSLPVSPQRAKISPEGH